VVPCGANLTQSVRLAADVVCAGGNGITLAADGVELNLNGHRLISSVEGAGLGVYVTAADVTVRNGSIVGWNTAVTTQEASTDDGAPPQFTGTLRDVRIDRADVGVDVYGGGRITVRDSVVRNTYRGVTATFGGQVRVESSTLERNTTGAWSFGLDGGSLVIRDSLIRNNSFAGVSCSQDGGYDVDGSTLQRNGYGLEVFECNGQVTNSRFVWNRQHVGGYLVPRDRIDLICNSYTSDGSPVPFPVQPCPAGTFAPSLAGVS
jgi:sulfur transfer complex TusBCD TusB component (DsrH family)